MCIRDRLTTGLFLSPVAPEAKRKSMAGWFCCAVASVVAVRLSLIHIYASGIRELDGIAQQVVAYLYDALLVAIQDNTLRALDGKFTNAGSVSLVISYDGNRLTLVVEDTGTGMSAEEQMCIRDSCLP